MASIDKQRELYGSLMAKKRLIGMRNLFFFHKHIVEEDPVRKEFIVPHVHGEWAKWYHNSKARIKLILVPRGTFKSTFFTVSRCLQEFADPEKRKRSRILIANAKLATAQKFLGEIKAHIKGNQTYRDLYGELFSKTNRWNDTEIDIVGKSLGVKDPSITTAGVGAEQVGSHYNLIIGDDLVGLENSSSRLQSEKVIDWWKRSLSLLDPDGEMVLIGTRWAYYELYHFLMNQTEIEVDTYIRGAYLPSGELYFPELLNEDKLAELKKSQGPYIFSSFYLNDPVDDESALIKKSQIRYYEDKELPRILNIFSCCDPAVSQDRHADNSSITTVGIDVDDNWYVLEVRRGKWTVGRLVEEMFAVNERWKPLNMSIEVIGLGQGLMTPIRDEEMRRHVYLPLSEIKSRPPIRKEMRIRSVLQPRFERGKIFIKREHTDVEDELLRFPKAEHDDIIDSITDVSEIGYAPDNGEWEPTTTGEFFQDYLLRNRNKKEDDYVDEVLGEYC